VTGIPNWWMKGDWFDVCSCNIACPCGFAQAPTNNHCEGVMAYHIREGGYGDVKVDGLNVIAVVVFDGNAWAKESKVSLGIFMDERATAAQRDALQKVFSGQAGGWMGIFAELVGEVRGLEFVPIQFEVAKDLAHWRDTREVEGVCRGAFGTDHSGRCARAASQRPWVRSRARSNHDVGQSGGQPSRRVRSQVELGRQVKQTYPLRLDRTEIRVALEPWSNGQQSVC
jgi:hypothetical protein